VQERLISPEGTFPVIGRSATYRFGAFQVLSLAALRHRLPKDKDPGAVRSALHAVISRMIEAPGTFDDKGWLRIGVVGAQPAQAEGYINSGSVYLCTLGLLHLGLPGMMYFGLPLPRLGRSDSCGRGKIFRPTRRSRTDVTDHARPPSTRAQRTVPQKTERWRSSRTLS
jgi:hypothetical protein